MKEKLKSQKFIIAIIIAVIVAAYLILPFDIIPDVAVGPGQIDDAVVALVGLALEIFNFFRGGQINNNKDKKEEYDDASYREVNK